MPRRPDPTSALIPQVPRQKGFHQSVTVLAMSSPRHAITVAVVMRRWQSWR